MNRTTKSLFLAALAIPLIAVGAGEPVEIRIQTDAPGKPVSPTLHGIFFEDINYAADGGLYAELIQNRSFEHRDKLYSWRAEGANAKLEIASDQPLNANNPHFLRLSPVAAGETASVANGGFDGIALTRNAKYNFSVYARAASDQPGEFVVSLKDASGKNIGGCRITGIQSGWKKFESQITGAETAAGARLVLETKQPLDLDMVSLFPENTFKGRRNGLRADLAQLLADLKPGFMRFPGGCIVEGRDFETMYRWKDTIGDVSERKQNWNLWADRTSPQYHQTYGLGFFEFFQLCEDIGAEPLPVVNCGMCCQARRGPAVPMGQLDPFVQDALDLIEFANGDVTTTWGAKRAAMGHPEPFNMKFLGVGNEQWEQPYFERYMVFHRALKAKHPEIQIVTTSGPHPDDPLFHFAWEKFRSGTPADIVDEHYYRPPQWFLEHHNRYDSYDRNGPKIFAGEYAAHDSGRRNSLRAAIAEAVCVTGLWRNADVVTMASYAPLFAKAGHVQWRPDLIWFDNTRVFGSPSYYVQQMAGQNRPDFILPVTLNSPAIEPPPLAGRIGVGTWRTQAEFKDIVVTKDGKTVFQSDFSKNFDGWETHNGDWSVVDGALRQTGNEENVRAFAGDTNWSDYTLSLKARKISGSEGFLVSFASKDPNSVTWWNIGGWENTQHGLEVPGAASPYVPGKIESGRWYDIRIELRGASVKCFLDGKLVQQAASVPTPALFAAAGRDARTGETIVAVANAGDAAIDAAIHLAGTKSLKPVARAITLTSARPEDENSFEQPGKVLPEETTFTVSAPKFERRLPANSFTVLRLAAN